MTVTELIHSLTNSDINTNLEVKFIDRKSASETEYEITSADSIDGKILLSNAPPQAPKRGDETDERYTCPECDGTMYWTGLYRAAGPQTYMHKCEKCGYTSLMMSINAPATHSVTMRQF